MRGSSGVLAIAFAIGLASPFRADGAATTLDPVSTTETRPTSAGLLDLTLEELMGVRVTSASKKEQSIGDVAAAVYVLSSEDLRRSGAMSIPEALRLVPGLQVAHLDANKWAISSRGFSDRFANKLLVLVDGRSIYTRLFSGVFWEALDIPFELIERIEVIRGPGASIWGANAVNGVINIITKPAGSLSYLAAGVGAGEHGRATGVIGREVRPGMQIRVHGNYADRSRGFSPGDRVDDSWRTGHAGLRLDWERNRAERIALFAEAGHLAVSSLSHIVRVEAPYEDLHASTDPLDERSAVLRWTRRHHDAHELSIQTSAQQLSLDIDRYLAYCEHTFAVEAVNRLRIGHRHEVVAGMEYRSVTDHVDSTVTASLNPHRATAGLWSAFFQEEWRTLGGRVLTTAGAKIERYRGEPFEVQPDLRLLVHPTKDQAVWAAVSRAVRTPARVEEALRYRAAAIPPSADNPGAPATLVVIEGNPDFGPERLLAYGAGYRVSVAEALSLDLTGFHDRYRHLRSNALGNPRLSTEGDVNYLEVPLLLVNGDDAKTTGGELLVQWRARSAWRLSAAYSAFAVHSGEKEATPLPPFAVPYPERSWFARSQWSPAERWELDVQARAAGRVPSGTVRSYLAGDIRLGYRWSTGLRAEFLAQNLLAGPHREFASVYGLTELTSVHPTYGLRVEWQR